MIYMDDNDDLWVFFENQKSYIDGPFLFCFDSQNFKFKKQIRLFTSTGRQLIDGFPFYAGQDFKGRFILGSQCAHLAKIEESGRRLFHKVIMKHGFLRSRGKNYKRLYFIRVFKKRKGDDLDKDKRGSNDMLHMLSMAMDKSSNLIFIGQGCRCCPNDIVVINDEGKLLYHFPFPVGPEALCARGGKLYLADYYHNFVHVTDYKGKWIKSFDILNGKNRLENHYVVEGGALKPNYMATRPDPDTEKGEAYGISAMCTAGEDDLALAMTDGSILLMGEHGEIRRKTEPPENMSPVSIATASSGELYVYYQKEQPSDYLGIYRISQDGRMAGPFLPGELGIFESREKYLRMRIAACGADAFDYFDLADILIRKGDVSEAIVGYLKKAICLKPDFGLAVAYLGLTLKKLGDVSEGVALMEEAFPKILCPVLAAEILVYYFHVKNYEKAMAYYRALESIDGEVEMEGYSEEITTEEIKRYLGLEKNEDSARSGNDMAS